MESRGAKERCYECKQQGEGMQLNSVRPRGNEGGYGEEMEIHINANQGKYARLHLRRKAVFMRSSYYLYCSITVPTCMISCTYAFALPH